MKTLILLLAIVAVSCKHSEPNPHAGHPAIEVWDSATIANYYIDKYSIQVIRDSSNNVILQIPADTSYIEFYGKRFYPDTTNGYNYKDTKLYNGKISGNRNFTFDNDTNWIILNNQPHPAWIEYDTNALKSALAPKAKDVYIPNGISPIDTTIGRIIIKGEIVSNITIDSNWLKQRKR